MIASSLMRSGGSGVVYKRGLVIDSQPDGLVRVGGFSISKGIGD